MKSRKSKCIAAMTLFVALAISVRLRVAAQEQQPNKQHTRYKLIDLGTFGGPRSYVIVNNVQIGAALNNRGIVAGWADTSTPDPFPNACFNGDCFVSHAFQSQNGVLTDLGVLPGGASSASSGISANGLIVGISENGLIDPLLSGFPEFRAVLWQNGSITDLGTLPEGGYESIGNAVNSRGEVVGVALNTVPDPNSMFGLGYQTRAFLWQNGAMQDLGTLGTGTDAQAILINESGQVSGWSYINSTPTQAGGCLQNFLTLSTDSFVWRNGKLVDLGSLGGTCTLSTDLNNRGQVVGLSYLPGDAWSHPFLWDRGVLTDLGTLGGSFGVAAANNDAGEIAGYSSIPGDQFTHGAFWKNGVITDLGTVGSDQCSYSFGINSKGQVLGISQPSCNGVANRATLSENGGPMVDLNTLIPPGSAFHLSIPITINDRGEIAGVGLPPGCSPQDLDFCGHAFVLIPCAEGDEEGCGDNAADAPAATEANPAPVTERPFTATPTDHAFRGRGMLDRLRARRFPGLRTPGPATGPASAQKQQSLACTATDGTQADRDLKYYGSCEVNEATGKLDGYCETHLLPYYTCYARSSANCPKGAKPIHPAFTPCSLFSVEIDSGRSCSF
jgi:probable HAF family extracellular repeat protein